MRPQRPDVSSMQSCLQRSAYVVDLCSLLSTFLHNTFYVKDVQMAGHGQCKMWERPPNILDCSAEKHFHYTYVFLGDSQLGISYISNSEKNLPLNQSYRFHVFPNDTASCLCQTDGIYCDNILQTMCHSLHRAIGHVAFSTGQHGTPFTL